FVVLLTQGVLADSRPWAILWNASGVAEEGYPRKTVGWAAPQSRGEGRSLDHSPRCAWARSAHNSPCVSAAITVPTPRHHCPSRPLLPQASEVSCGVICFCSVLP